MLNSPVFNRIPLETGNRRNGRPESIASEDSVNLDDLINNNFTADMEDETDLSDLANLDLDDSADDFFKMESKPNSNVKTILIIIVKVKAFLFY